MVAAPAASADLEPGSHGPAVKRLGERLAELGYLSRNHVGSHYTRAVGWAVTAFQKQEEIGIDGIVGPETRVVLKVAERPLAPAGTGRRVVVVLSSQLAYLVGARDRVRRTISVSTGRAGNRTPRGTFHVYRRARRSFSYEYGIWLRWAAYFEAGYALHGSWRVPAHPASHGCVRVPVPFAREVFEFARVGTKIAVR